MKTIFTNPKVLAVMLFLFASPLLASAEIYSLYLCGGATASLKPDATVEAALAVGDKVVWQEFDASDNPTGTPTELTVAAVGVAPAFTTATGLAVGEHTFKVFVIAVNPSNCSGDVSDGFSLYVLPNKTLTLGVPSATSFCEGVTGASSAIVATPTITGTLPESVTYEYSWSAVKGTDPAVDGTTIGTATSNATTGTLTINNATAGTYVVSASVKYVVPTGSTLKSSDNAGCDQVSTNTRTVTVTPKPGKPTITFS